MPQYRGNTIVIVEDDAGLNQAIRRLVGAAGFQPLTFDTAEQLLTCDAAQNADCLLLDLHLPGISGLELYEKLHRAGVRRPAIFITAHDDPDTRQRICKVGRYLRKPFVGQTLLQIIDEVLQTTNNT
jgi:FixJ family two-component response regulator